MSSRGPIQLILNTPYEFNLGDMSHCGLSHDEMIEHYKTNSSPCSFLVEKLLAKWFPNIIYDNTRVKVKKGNISIIIAPDLRDKKTKQILFDQKAFNYTGGSFIRSIMKGGGREMQREAWELWCKKQVFIWTDFTNLPYVKVIAIPGKDCLERFPKGKIKYNLKDEIFNNKTLLPISLEKYLEEHFDDEEK